MIRPATFATLCCVFLLSAAPQRTHAQSAAPASTDALVMSSDSFLGSHPDLRYRMLGLESYKKGRFSEALTFFRRASRFADKPSQGMVAEMLWQGVGTAQDRPLAYAWMDLAAERGFEVMLINRERYWRDLSEAERPQALQAGEAVFADYGDDVAKPRLERILRAARRNVTGSRVGFTGNLTIIIPGPTGDITLDGSQFYQEKFWKPETYWQWQAESWKESPKGRVEVGPLTVSPEPAAEGTPERKH